MVNRVPSAISKMWDSLADSAIGSPSVSMSDSMAPARAFAVLQGREHGDDALQPGVDIRMAAGIAPRLGKRLAEMILHDRGQAGFSLHGLRKGRTGSPGGRLSI